MIKINSLYYIIVFTVTLFNPNIFPQNFLTAGWEKVNQTEIEEALQIFLEDAEKKSNADSYLAAAFLEEILVQNGNSLKHFLAALEISKNAEPFLFAAMHSPRITENMYTNPSIVNLLKEIAETTNDGLIRTYMFEKIGKYYEEIAQLDSALKYFNRMGALKTWNVIGPFENISGSGFYTKYFPETKFDQQKKYTGKENKIINWFEPAEYRIDGWVDFLCYFSEPNSIFYGNTFVYSKDRQKVQIRVGTSGSLRTFLNDQLILEVPEETNNNADTFVAETYLQKGWNRLLIKVGYSEIDYCNFMVRITDEAGFVKDDLAFSNESKEYPANTKEDYKIIKSSVEEFFEERIKLQPDNPVNYLLLGEVYSINGKSYESEIVYKEGMKKFPENILLPIHLAGRYMRDDKPTLYYSLIDKVDKRRDDIPIIIESKLGKEMADQNKENFTSMFDKYNRKFVDNRSFYKNLIFYNAIQGKVNELIALVDSAYKKFPYDYDFVFFKANLDYTLTKNFEPTIKILEEYTAKNYSIRALKYLTTLYVAISDWEKWRGVYNTLLKYEPAESQYYYEMAQKLYQTMDYPKAITAIKSAIKISPFNSDYYYLLGLCQKSINENNESLKSFQMAIQNNYANYDARDQVKLMVNNSEIDQELENINIDEIIASAPGAEEYPSDDDVALVKNAHYTVYDGRASEYKEELLIRVLNDKGVEWYSNVNITYFSNQSLNIEKALVIKTDGSKIEGEINESQIVFKSLEKNDFVYVRYKLRNHNKGLLSGHFWEVYNLSSFQPVKKFKLSVLIPENDSLIIKTFNMDESPTRTKVVGASKLLVWEKENIPAMEYEYYMPTVFDLGPNIYFSTLDNWNLIGKWYFDITRSKIREHFEIKNKVAELFEGKENLSANEKIRLVYEFITKEISYVYVPFLQSEFVPQKASDVLTNKIGDCKDVVTLFIAMLKEIGINSNYVLVRTIDEGRLFNAPAGMFFNHVIATTYLDGKNQYYDLTAKDYPCFSLPEVLDGVLALEIKEEESEPFYMESDDIINNHIKRITKVVINEDLSATVNINSFKRGESAVVMRSLYKGISYDQRIKKLTEILSTDLSNYTVNTFNIDNLDMLTTEIPYDFNLTLNGFMNKTGNYGMFKIPWSDALYQNTALSYNKREYPYIIYSLPNSLENIEIELPKGYEPVELPENISLSCNNASCSITYEIKNGIIKANREFRLLNRSVTSENYASYKEFYNKVMETENVQILLKQLK